MAISIRTLSSVGILKIDGTTQVDRVSIVGLNEIEVVLGPTVFTRPEIAHLVTAIVDGSPYAVNFVQWTQLEIDALDTKTLRLTGADISSYTNDVTIEVDPQT